MRKTHIGLVLLAVAAFGSATAAHDGPAPSGARHNRPAFVFHSIDMPGATSTNAWDLNSGSLPICVQSLTGFGS
jgi:hypothetical protein